MIAFFFFARAAGREIRGRWQEREGSDTKWVQTRKDWQRKNIQQKQRFKWIPGVQFFYASQPLHLHWMVIPRDHCNSGIKQVELASLCEQGFNTKVALLTSITFFNSFSRFYRNHWNFYMTTASNRCVKITQAWNNWAAITRWKLLFATFLPNKVRHLQQLQWLSIQQYMAQQLTNRTIINVSLNPFLQTPHKHRQIIQSQRSITHREPRTAIVTQWKMIAHHFCHIPFHMQCGKCFRVTHWSTVDTALTATS